MCAVCFHVWCSLQWRLWPGWEHDATAGAKEGEKEEEGEEGGDPEDGHGEGNQEDGYSGIQPAQLEVGAEDEGRDEANSCFSGGIQQAQQETGEKQEGGSVAGETAAVGRSDPLEQTTAEAGEVAWKSGEEWLLEAEKRGGKRNGAAAVEAEAEAEAAAGVEGDVAAEAAADAEAEAAAGVEADAAAEAAAGVEADAAAEAEAEAGVEAGTEEARPSAGAQLVALELVRGSACSTIETMTRDESARPPCEAGDATAAGGQPILTSAEEDRLRAFTSELKEQLLQQLTSALASVVAGRAGSEREEGKKGRGEGEEEGEEEVNSVFANGQAKEAVTEGGSPGAGASVMSYSSDLSQASLDGRHMVVSGVRKGGVRV